MSFSNADPFITGHLDRRSTVVALGGRAMYERRLTEHIFVRGLFELKGILKQATLFSIEGRESVLPSKWFSFSAGLGLGVSL